MVCSTGGEAKKTAQWGVHSSLPRASLTGIELRTRFVPFFGYPSSALHGLALVGANCAAGTPTPQPDLPGIKAQPLTGLRGILIDLW